MQVLSTHEQSVSSMVSYPSHHSHQPISDVNDLHSLVVIVQELYIQGIYVERVPNVCTSMCGQACLDRYWRSGSVSRLVSRDRHFSDRFRINYFDLSPRILVPLITVNTD